MLPSTIARMMPASTHCAATSEIAAANDQDQDERALELAQQKAKSAEATRIFNAVGTDRRKQRCGTP